MTMYAIKDSNGFLLHAAVYGGTTYLGTKPIVCFPYKRTAKIFMNSLCYAGAKVVPVRVGLCLCSDYKEAENGIS